MRPQSAKAKGRKLQQITRDLILELNPELSKDDVRSTSMGAGGEDVLLSPKAREFVPFQIENKNKNHISIYTWYDQCKEHGPHEPLLVLKEDYADPVVVVDARTFFLMLRKLKDGNV
jgi:hypothetical protein